MKSPLSSSLIKHLYHQISWEELDTEAIRSLVSLAKDEDLAGFGLKHKPSRVGDVTTALMNPQGKGKAQLVARQAMVLCGLPLIPLILEQYGTGSSFIPFMKDGSRVNQGTCFGAIEGPFLILLQAERVILNFLQHLSGIASQTEIYVDTLKASNTRILDTRKTTPGFRVLEKYAVACGGGWNHRMGLFDRVMLKDNHLAASESQTGTSLANLVKEAHKQYPDLVIEVEVDTVDQIKPVIDSGAHVILLDNFSIDALKIAVNLIEGKLLIEASGGITLKKLSKLGGLGLDFISSGALIHQSQWMDIGLDWQ